jgi:hypothetical protein
MSCISRCVVSSEFFLSAAAARCLKESKIVAKVPAEDQFKSNFDQIQCNCSLIVFQLSFEPASILIRSLALQFCNDSNHMNNYSIVASEYARLTYVQL